MLVHSCGHIVGSDSSPEFDSAWEKHTQVTERPPRSAQGLSLHILTHLHHTVVGTAFQR